MPHLATRWQNEVAKDPGWADPAPGMRPSVQGSEQKQVSLGPWFCSGKVGFPIIHCSIFLPDSTQVLKGIS